MGIVVLGAVFVDIKGYPTSTYIPGGRNVGRVEQVPGGGILTSLAIGAGACAVGYVAGRIVKKKTGYYG